MQSTGIIPTIDWRTHSYDLEPIVHELHPTGMEQFMSCPFKFHVQDRPDLFPEIQFGTPDSAREAFYEGDITEQLMTAYQYGDKLGDQVLMNFGNSTEFHNYSRLQKHAENRKEYIKKSNPSIQNRFPLFTQKRMSLIILMDGENRYHEIHLTGTADRVYSDWTIADCKTAKSKWGKNEPDFRLQWRLYPRMRRTVSHLPSLKNKDTFKFTYYVFTKQVTPQLQVIELEYNYEDSERLIFHLLNEYTHAYDEDNREPKKCLACKRCPLRQQCPRYGSDGLTDFVTTDTKSEDYIETRF